MADYILRRLFYALLLLIGISIISFLIIQLPPGNYLSTVEQHLRDAGYQEDYIREQVEALSKRYGIGQPLPQQYWKWASGLVVGDLGYSFQWEQPVATLIGERLALTVAVSLVTLVFTWLVAVPIGIYSATHQYSLVDYVFTSLGFIGMSVPSFLLALFLAYGLFKLAGISAIGLFSPEYATATWSFGKVLDLIQHMILPVTIVGIGGTGSLIRVLRASVLDELGKAYVATARAKGLSERRMLWKYPVRIAVNPLLSTMGWMLPSIMSGTVIVAVVLNLPMAGELLLRALRFQDMYLATSFIMILSALTVVGTFISDLLLGWSDPRIRFLD